MENNDELREKLAKKALPKREFFDVPIGGGYSKSLLLCAKRRKQRPTMHLAYQ